MGVKGVGEAGTIASTPCVVNAVCNVLSPVGAKPWIFYLLAKTPRSSPAAIVFCLR